MKNKFEFSRKGLKHSFYIVFAFFVFILLIFPLPYVIETPGSAESVREFVTVDKKRDQFSGEFLLTSVSVQQASLLTLAYYSFDKNADVLSKQDVFGDKIDEEDYDLLQEYMMLQSQEHALEVVLKEANISFTKENKGVTIVYVPPTSEFYRKLVPGDKITKIDNKKISNFSDVEDLLKEQVKKGQVVSVEVQRGSKELQFKGEFIDLDDKKVGLGIGLTDTIKIETKPDIKFNIEDIGGPSGGLMFSLELLGMLTNQDLTNGEKIAGTGTIELNGEVGQIGGISKKIVAADRAGATVFLAPDLSEKELKKYDDSFETNYQEALKSAKRNNLDIEIVPVKNFKEAVAYLEKTKR